MPRSQTNPSMRTNRIRRAKRGALGAALVASVAAVIVSPVATAQPCQPAWDNGFDLVISAPSVGDPGLDGTVNAMVVFDDGTGPALYAGGSFTTPGGVLVNGIAKWDGSSWSPLASGVSGGFTPSVNALVVFDDGTGLALYVGGDFTMAGGVSVNGVAKWDGSTWSPLVGGGLGTVRALAVFNDGTGSSLYQGGFSVAGSSFIAKWDGSSWIGVGGGITSNGNVSALTVFDDGTGAALFIGGTFTSAGGVSASNIAKWDGSVWTSLGSGVSSQVNALIAFDNGTGPALYAGGNFFNAGGLSASRIAKWNGLSWSPLGSGMNSTVSSLTVFDDGMDPVLYAGGFFTTAGGVSSSRIAKWDGSSWSALGIGINGEVNALTVFNDATGSALYAGGNFTTAGGFTADRIGKWNGDAWFDAQGNSVDNTINKLTTVTTPSGTELFATGTFVSAGGTTSRSVGRFDGQQWQTLGGGVNSGGSVNDLAVFDDGTGAAVYAGGSFSSVGGTTVNNIAKWDGVAWSPLGTGLNSGVNALAVFDDGSGAALYAGCDFFNAGGVAVNRIAKWDGLAWTPLGELGAGLGGAVVNDLAVFDDGAGPALYVAGAFTSAGGDPSIAFLAKWDGAAWSALGTGVNSTVTALDVLDNGMGPALWVRGSFTTAGGLSSRHIAMWNGSTWNQLGGGAPGFSDIINDLAVFNDGAGPAVYATGTFTVIGGAAINRIAKWDGASWSGLGPIGLNNEGKTLAVFNDGNGVALYAGGTFTEAGGLAARHVARWDGLSWSVLDLGIDGTGTGAGVNALAVFDGPTGPALYAGGSFISSGGLPASNFARWNGCAVPVSASDLNGDGFVNAADLATLLAQWGPCPPPPAECAADINSDGVVNAADLAQLLASWG